LLAIVIVFSPNQSFYVLEQKNIYDQQFEDFSHSWRLNTNDRITNWCFKLNLLCIVYNNKKHTREERTCIEFQRSDSVRMGVISSIMQKWWYCTLHSRQRFFTFGWWMRALDSHLLRNIYNKDTETVIDQNSGRYLLYSFV
jgi:hypothetical protein